ncbi:MAG: hypothetical protein JWQ25_2081 [Daejeonella sp.]|nr:hypothetical protein [Daejeonella sp.]
MMEKLGCVIYASLVGKGYSITDTEMMLKSARESRCDMNLTGVAIFANGVLLTLIEGEVNNVNNYFKGLTNYLGAGLQNVIKLLDRPIQKRSFGKYCLAFKTYDEYLQPLDDFKEAKDQIFFEEFLSKSNTISKMVKTFVIDQTS